MADGNEEPLRAHEAAHVIGLLAFAAAGLVASTAVLCTAGVVSGLWRKVTGKK